MPVVEARWDDASHRWLLRCPDNSVRPLVEPIDARAYAARELQAAVKFVVPAEPEAAKP